VEASIDAGITPSKWRAKLGAGRAPTRPEPNPISAASNCAALPQLWTATRLRPGAARMHKIRMPASKGWRDF